MFIKSIGYYIPEGRKTNADVTQMIAEFNQTRFNAEDLDFLKYGSTRKFEFLGLDTRSCCAPRDNFCTMAQHAAEQAIEKANLSPKDIDCLIFSGVTNPFREPSFAIVLANKLGITSGDFFDINDTCSGFIKSLEIAALYINSGKYRNILVSCCESPFELMQGLQLDIQLDTLDDIDKRLSGLIVGSGAAAMVVSAEGEQGNITHYCEKRTSRDWDTSILTVPGTTVPDSKYGEEVIGFWSDARFISAALIRQLPEFIEEQFSKWQISAADIDCFIFHQLGDNITFAVMDKIKAPHEKAPINTFRALGNMATVNIPVNLAMAVEKGLIKKGDSVLLVASSCGLSYALLRILW